MKLYLGVTDTQCFRFLQAEPPEEVNFWKPGGGNAFKVLPVGGPFLFKLKAPLNAISGAGRRFLLCLSSGCPLRAGCKGDCVGEAGKQQAKISGGESKGAE